MTDITERLRSYGPHHHDVRLHFEAADEIEHLTLDLHTERAAVVALQAEIAALRKSASLRVQFHAAGLADMTAERDMWKDTPAQRDRELASARAIEAARKAAP